MANIDELRIRLAPWLADCCSMNDDEIDATLAEMDQAGITIVHVPIILDVIYGGQFSGIRADDLFRKWPEVHRLSQQAADDD